MVSVRVEDQARRGDAIPRSADACVPRGRNVIPSPWMGRRRERASGVSGTGSSGGVRLLKQVTQDCGRGGPCCQLAPHSVCVDLPYFSFLVEKGLGLGLLAFPLDIDPFCGG